MISFEQSQEIGRKLRESKEEMERIQKKANDDYLRSIGVNPDQQEHIQPRHDSVYALENGGATILWLIVAIGALIFNGGWILSIIATGVWFNYITRDQ